MSSIINKKTLKWRSALVNKKSFSFLFIELASVKKMNGHEMETYQIFFKLLGQNIFRKLGWFLKCFLSLTKKNIKMAIGLGEQKIVFFLLVLLIELASVKKNQRIDWCWARPAGEIQLETARKLGWWDGNFFVTRLLYSIPPGGLEPCPMPPLNWPARMTRSKAIKKKNSVQPGTSPVRDRADSNWHRPVQTR